MYNRRDVGASRVELLVINWKKTLAAFEAFLQLR